MRASCVKSNLPELTSLANAPAHKISVTAKKDPRYFAVFMRSSPPVRDTESSNPPWIDQVTCRQLLICSLIFWMPGRESRLHNASLRDRNGSVRDDSEAARRVLAGLRYACCM